MQNGVTRLSGTFLPTACQRTPPTFSRASGWANSDAEAAERTLAYNDFVSERSRVRSSVKRRRNGVKTLTTGGSISSSKRWQQRKSSLPEQPSRRRLQSIGRG